MCCMCDDPLIPGDHLRFSLEKKAAKWNLDLWVWLEGARLTWLGLFKAHSKRWNSLIFPPVLALFFPSLLSDPALSEAEGEWRGNLNLQLIPLSPYQHKFFGWRGRVKDALPSTTMGRAADQDLSWVRLRGPFLEAKFLLFFLHPLLSKNWVSVRQWVHQFFVCISNINLQPLKMSWASGHFRIWNNFFSNHKNAISIFIRKWISSLSPWRRKKFFFCQKKRKTSHTWMKPWSTKPHSLSSSITSIRFLLTPPWRLKIHVSHWLIAFLVSIPRVERKKERPHTQPWRSISVTRQFVCICPTTSGPHKEN